MPRRPATPKGVSIPTTTLIHSRLRGPPAPAVSDARVIHAGRLVRIEHIHKRLKAVRTGAMIKGHGQFARGGARARGQHG